MCNCSVLPFCGSLILFGGPGREGRGSDLHGYWVCIWGLQRSQAKGKQTDLHQKDTEGMCCWYKAWRQPPERVSHGTSMIP